MSTFWGLVSFVTKESEAALSLYFEPLRRMLFLLLPRKKVLLRESASKNYVQQALGLLPRYEARPGVDRLTITVIGNSGVGKSRLICDLIETSESPRMGFGRGLSKIDMQVYEGRNKIVVIDSPVIEDPSSDRERIFKFLGRESDCILFVLDATRFSETDMSHVQKFLGAGKSVLVLLSRTDLVPEHELLPRLKAIESKTGLIPIPLSTRTGLNVQEIRAFLLSWANDSST